MTILIDHRATDAGRAVHTTESVDADRFRNVLSRYPTGVTAITAIDSDGQPVAMTVGTFTSVSLDPPLIAFFPDKKSTSFPRIRDVGYCCVNVLSADQAALSAQFARSAAEKFDGVSWSESPSGSPLLDGVCAWIDCEIETIAEAGDHYAVIARVHDLGTGESAPPLVFHGRGYGQFTPLDPTNTA